MISDNELWILSYYRHSEISGALFFGALSRTFRTGIVGHNLSKHFADESQHAWYWTECINALGHEPLKVDRTYQEQYLEAIGLPVNLMEILAITRTFEKRVINQYTRHAALPNLDPLVAATFAKIMGDERWHLQWIQKALKSMEPEYGKAAVANTLKRYAEADQEIYARTLKEHEQRIEDLFQKRMS
jgi:bacterioferritin (cytochrome b1)